MPEMTFTVRWPDGAVEECYSPSLVMHDHLAAGESYPVEEFVSRSSAGLAVAGERVRAAYGFECTSALHQRESIERAAAGQEGDVTVLAMHPPLPPHAPARSTPDEGRADARG